MSAAAHLELLKFDRYKQWKNYMSNIQSGIGKHSCTTCHLCCNFAIEEGLLD